MTSAPHRRPVTLGVLTLSHAVGAMCFTAVVAMAPAVRADLSLSAAEFGFLASGYSIAQAVFGIPIGNLVDRIGVRRALALAGALSLHFAPGFATALLAMTLFGFAYSFVNPATGKGVLDWFSRARRGTAMGVKQSGVPIGGVIGAGLGALAGVYDWRDLLFVIVAFGLAGAALCAALPPSPRHASRAGGVDILTDLHRVLRDRNLGLFNLGTCFFQAGQLTFLSYITLFMREGLMASQPLAAASLGVAQAASAVGRLGWGAVSDFLFRGRRRPVLVLTALLGAAALLGLGALGPGWGVPAGLGLTAIIGMSVAGYVALAQTLVVETARPDLAATAVGYNRLLASVGGSIGPPLFGLLVDATEAYGAGWLLNAVFVLGAALLIGVWFREGKD
jgi:predicted MFS family arabinose efflux permease